MAELVKAGGGGVVLWTLAEDPKADAVLIVGNSERWHIRRAFLDVCSPIFAALPDQSEIPVIDFTVDQMDLFLKFVHPRLHWTVSINVSSILAVAPVAHFYEVEPMIEKFVTYLQENYNECITKASDNTLDAIVMVERLRKRTDGEPCPWNDEILKQIFVKRIYTPQEMEFAVNPDCRGNRFVIGPDPASKAVIDMNRWNSMKPETQEAVLLQADFYMKRQNFYPLRVRSTEKSPKLGSGYFFCFFGWWCAIFGPI
jgi:hypothetical protein